MAYIHTYDEWILNEGLLDSFKNGLSRLFGGDVGKLDKLLSDYRDNEDEYWTRWIEARDKLAKASTLSMVDKEPIEQSKYDEQKKRVQKLLSQIEDTKSNTKDALTKQATLIIGNNDRLRQYWDLEKAKLDAEVAKDNYNGAKKYADDKVLDQLYAEVEELAQKVKKQESEFVKTEKDEAVGPVQPETKVAAPAAPVVPPKPAASNAVDKDAVGKYFDAYREQIEADTGSIKDDDYAKLRTDLLRLFSELVNSNSANPRDAKDGLVNMAGEIYNRKKKKNALGKELSKDDIDDEVREFKKENS